MQRSRQQQRGKQSAADRVHPNVAGFKSAGPSFKMQGDSMASRRTKEPPTALQDGSEVEQEYIGNLQKQVYFLELESKLLREKLDDKPADSLDVPGPLDDHLVKLKQKFGNLEKDMQTKNQILQEQIHELKRELDESQQDRAESNALNHELEKQIEDLTFQLEGGGDELVKQMKLLETRLTLSKDDASAQRKEVELMRAKILAARVDREEEFNSLAASLLAAKELQRKAEEDAERQLKQLKVVEVQRMSQDEEIELFREQEEARKGENKKLNDENCNLELELRQVTAERDHGKAAITKLETDHRKACEDAAEAAKKSFESNREIREMKQMIEMAARTREDQASDFVDTREKMLRALADQEVSVAEKARLTSKLDELEHSMLGMKHEERMWKEEKDLIEKEREGHEERVYGTEEQSGKLRAELSLAKQSLDRREEQVKALRAELKKMKELRIKTVAELASAQDKLLLASELDELKLEEFVTMRNSNLEVAKKIERFMEKTKNSKAREAASILDDPLLHDD